MCKSSQEEKISLKVRDRRAEKTSGRAPELGAVDSKLGEAVFRDRPDKLLQTPLAATGQPEEGEGQHPEPHDLSRCWSLRITDLQSAQRPTGECKVERRNNPANSDYHCELPHQDRVASTRKPNVLAESVKEEV